MNIKLGSRVKFNNDHMHFAAPCFYPESGTIGIVTGVDTSDGSYRIKWSTGSTSGNDEWFVCGDDIEYVERTFSKFESYSLNEKEKSKVPDIEDVIFNNPATIVKWSDGTKTIVKCQPMDYYSKEVGLTMCIAKKALGNKSNFNDVVNKWIK